MQKEIWKTVQNFGGNYEASNLGNIKSKPRNVLKSVHGVKTIQRYKEKLLKQFTNKRGYKIVRFGFNNEKYHQQVGRMVLMAFVGMPDNDQGCCHNNSNPSDNRIENLRWGTQKENMQDRMEIGNYPIGEEHPLASLKNKQVLEIYNSDERVIDLANKFNTTTATISSIKKGRTWGKITREN